MCAVRGATKPCRGSGPSDNAVYNKEPEEEL